MHPENEIPQKMSRPFQHKIDFEGDTNENNRDINALQSGNDNFVIKLDK